MKAVEYPEVTSDLRASLRDTAERATPGPWMWMGQRKSYYVLATQWWGRRFVMQFCRLGMRSAQPMFQTYRKREGDDPYHWDGIMDKAVDLAVQEVAYRDDIVDIANPDARYIARMDPTTVLALLNRIDELESDVHSLRSDLAIDATGSY